MNLFVSGSLYILTWALIPPLSSLFQMATLLRAPFTAPPPQSLTSICTQSPKAFHLPLTRRCALNASRLTSSLRFSPILHIRFLRFDPFASNGEATETQEVQDSEIEVNGFNLFNLLKPFLGDFLVGVWVFGMFGWWVSVRK